MMQLYNRIYQNGDEIKINRLYKLISGVDRNAEKFYWEWINTWNGQGEIHLLFDQDRIQSDNLIAQYSLIPVPFSIFGKYYISGKTENCMCHTDYRKRGVYLSHEKKCFELAKKRFQIFYTTAGRVSNWAAAAVRSKIGYIPLDSWSAHFICLNVQSLPMFILSQLKKDKFEYPFSKYFAFLTSFILYYYCKLKFSSHNTDLNGYIKHDKDVDLYEIEKLWNENKFDYGITNDRNAIFLKWRIVDNPNIDYSFSLLKKSNELIGYVIYYFDEMNIMHIEDMLAKNKDKKTFKMLLDDIIAIGRYQNAAGIHCKTLMGNSFLRGVLLTKGFIDLRIYAIKEIFSKSKKQFLVYLPDEVRRNRCNLKPKNWYITNLVSEGR